MYRYEKMVRRQADQYGFEVTVTDGMDGYEVEVWTGGSGFEFEATYCHVSVTNQGSFPELSPAGIWKQAWEDVKHLRECEPECSNRVS